MTTAKAKNRGKDPGFGVLEERKGSIKRGKVDTTCKGVIEGVIEEPMASRKKRREDEGKKEGRKGRMQVGRRECREEEGRKAEKKNEGRQGGKRMKGGYAMAAE